MCCCGRAPSSSGTLEAMLQASPAPSPSQAYTRSKASPATRGARGRGVRGGPAGGGRSRQRGAAGASPLDMHQGGGVDEEEELISDDGDDDQPATKKARGKKPL